MKITKWVTHKDPDNKYSASIIWGDRNIVLPENTIVSITLGEHFSIWRTIINGIVNQFVMKQLAKSSGLLYSELWGDAKFGSGLTLTVWSGRSMASFRDSGSHKFALRFFSWVFFSGKVQSYFITYKPDGFIPSKEEAIHIVKTYGRHFNGGKLERKAQKPETIGKRF